MTATSRSSLRQADVRTAAESFGLFTSTSPQKLKLPNSPVMALPIYSNSSLQLPILLEGFGSDGFKLRQLCIVCHPGSKSSWAELPARVLHRDANLPFQFFWVCPPLPQDFCAALPATANLVLQPLTQADVVPVMPENAYSCCSLPIEISTMFLNSMVGVDGCCHSGSGCRSFIRRLNFSTVVSFCHSRVSVALVPP